MTIASRQDASPMPGASFFSLHGRMGRMDYIAHLLGSIAFVFVGLSIAAFALPLHTQFGQLVYTVTGFVLVYGFLLFRVMVLSIRRAHDFNRGGWLALLLLVPVANLLFCAIPGSRGENTYGPRPQPASASTRGVAMVLTLLFCTGLLASLQQSRQATSPAPAEPSNSSLKPYSP